MAELKNEMQLGWDDGMYKVPLLAPTIKSMPDNGRNCGVQPHWWRRMLVPSYH